VFKITIWDDTPYIIGRKNANDEAFMDSHFTALHKYRAAGALSMKITIFVEPGV
jgi:hypothetical protein